MQKLRYKDCRKCLRANGTQALKWMTESDERVFTQLIEMGKARDLLTERAEAVAAGQPDAFLLYTPVKATTEEG